MWIRVGLLSLVLLGGCATKNKCVAIDMWSDNSRLDIVTPGTDWFSISLGSVNLEGKNSYRSCPTGEDPKWMYVPPTGTVP